MQAALLRRPAVPGPSTINSTVRPGSNSASRQPVQTTAVSAAIPARVPLGQIHPDAELAQTERKRMRRLGGGLWARAAFPLAFPAEGFGEKAVRARHPA